MVLGVVTTAKSKIYKRWKHIDNSITDSLNEAKDNVKYLATLDKYTEPLYHGDPQVRTPSLLSEHVLHPQVRTPSLLSEHVLYPQVRTSSPYTPTQPPTLH